MLSSPPPQTIPSAAKEVVVLVELGLVDQRYKAVIARRSRERHRRRATYGVGRQTVRTAPRLGAAHDPEQACPRRRDSAALSVGHLPGARPPPAHRPQATAQAAQRLQALGALAGDGALADGHYARGAATGWLAPLDRDGHRRPVLPGRRHATARPVCGPAQCAERAGGFSDTSEVLFDRCRERIRHAPRGVPRRPVAPAP